MSWFSNLFSTAKASVGSVLRPISGALSVVVPGGSHLEAGLAVSDKVVKALNGAPGTTPREQAQAKRIVANTKALASSDHPAADAALNGLTLMKKRAAAMRAAGKFSVDPRGVVVVR